MKPNCSLRESQLWPRRGCRACAVLEWVALGHRLEFREPLGMVILHPQLNALFSMSEPQIQAPSYLLTL